jgi:hypothetical protein
VEVAILQLLFQKGPHAGFFGRRSANGVDGSVQSGYGACKAALQSRCRTWRWCWTLVVMGGASVGACRDGSGGRTGVAQLWRAGRTALILG